jgi:hypothetical protein
MSDDRHGPASWARAAFVSACTLTSDIDAAALIATLSK